MDDISIKNIRVMPTSLDIKTNVGKSSSEILNQLQSGSLISGVVIKADNNGFVIFNTPNGRFSAPNKHNLTVGDNISLKITNSNGKIEGNIVNINNKKLKDDSILELELIRPNQTPPTTRPTDDDPNANYITLKDIVNTPKVISGIISYLNLDNIAKSSPLFKMISSAIGDSNFKPTLSVNILPSDHIPTAAYSFNGVVSGNLKDSGQLIKTDFGIITTQDTKMPLGQKLLMEMTGLGERLIDNELTQAVTNFVYKLNNDDIFVKFFQNPLTLLLKAMDKNNIKTNSNKGSEHDENLFYEEQDERLSSGLIKKKLSSSSSAFVINYLSDLFKDNDEIKKLTVDYKHIKELLTPFVREQAENFRWQPIFIPIYDGYRIVLHEMKINRSREYYLRFIFDMEFGLNIVQIEGLIGFKADGKTPETFNMILRSKIKLESELCKKIADIYYVTQVSSGLRGTLSIEEFNQFTQT